MDGGNVEYNLLSGTGTLGRPYVNMINKEFGTKVTKDDKLCDVADKISNTNKHQLLILDGLNTFGPKEELTNTEWLSNEHIDKLVSGVNLFVWKDFDKKLGEDDLYAISSPEGRINCEEHFDLDDTLECMLMLKPLRYFLLRTKFNSCEQLCDKCYSLFPVYYVGCSGSDGFFPDLVSEPRIRLPKISTIAAFMRRYPDAHIFAIVNLVGFSEHKPGIHWVTLYFKGGVCTYYCSCGGDFSGLDFSDRIKQEFDENGITLSEYKSIEIQTDGYNCGVFAVFTILYNLISIMPDKVQAKIKNDKLVGKFVNTRH